MSSVAKILSFLTKPRNGVLCKKLARKCKSLREIVGLAMYAWLLCKSSTYGATAVRANRTLRGLGTRERRKGICKLTEVAKVTQSSKAEDLKLAVPVQIKKGILHFFCGQILIILLSRNHSALMHSKPTSLLKVWLWSVVSPIIFLLFP